MRTPELSVETERREDLPLMIKLGQPMPPMSPARASGPQGEETRAQYGTHVPTGPGDNYNDINVDWTFD